MQKKIIKSTIIILLFQFSLFTVYSQSVCWKVVKSSFVHSVGIKQNGSMWTWGSNAKGELGNGGVGSMSVIPILIEVGDEWKDISLGGALLSGGFTLALKEDGTLWSWGGNFAGQLGNGSTIASSIPVKIGIDSDWKAISAGYYHSVAIKANGTLWAWGSNVFGQLGNGNQNDISIPAKIGNDNDWLKVAAAGEHTIAMKTDGTLWAWGRNLYGALGVGNNNDSNIPIKIGNDNNWAEFTTGYAHVMAIKSDKSLWGWGDNYLGQIGNGTNVNTNVPVRVGSDNNWVSTACGHGHTIAIKENGKIYTWGFNYYGQLGNNSTSNANTPIEIYENSSDWKIVNAGWYNNFAIKNNGDLWVWGYNASGQLGLNSTDETFLMPVYINCPTGISVNENILTENITIPQNVVFDFINLKVLNSNILKIEIYNTQGKLIESINNKTNNDVIHCSHLPKGLYFLRIKTDKELKCFKLIKI